MREYEGWVAERLDTGRGVGMGEGIAGGAACLPVEVVTGAVGLFCTFMKGE
jgi:hypothetical protein